MKLVQLLKRLPGEVARVALLLALVLTALGAWRYLSHDQQDDSQHLAAKRDYLAQLSSKHRVSDSAPNIVFILYDDLGYGDLGAGASGLLATPNINQLAASGMVLSNFYSPAPVCTPARAGYLTGRLAPRAGLPNVVFPTGSGKALLFSRILNPRANTRLPAEEITLADVLKAVGYRTGMVGKWHLGDRSPSLPRDMGFEQYFGALYSNDMTPFALYRDAEIAVPAPVDQRQLNQIYTREAERFITEQERGPFLLYFAHNFPHDPLAVAPGRLGKSGAGLYGDVIESLDAGVGELVDALRQQQLLDNTLIIISSDNGPWFLGNAAGWRGRKGSAFEGGMRVPFIAHWPERIAAASRSDAMAMGIDLLPTVLDLLELPAPPDRRLDGRSLLPLLTANAPSPHDYLFYFDGDSLISVRDQRFKYRGPRGVHYGTDQMPVAAAVPQKEWLFDLESDPGESYDVSARYPQALARLRGVFRDKQHDMATDPRGWSNGQPAAD